MSTVLDGAEVAILIDGGNRRPFVLDIDVLGNDADGPDDRVPRQDYGDLLCAGIIGPMPASHWRLGETAGTFVNSGWENFTGSVGSPAVTRGAPGIAGTDGAVSSTTFGRVVYGELYTSLPTATVAAWVIWSGAGESYLFDHLISNGSGGFVGWRAQITTAGAMRLMLYGGSGTGQTIVSTATLTAGKRYHVAFAWSATYVYLYLDGAIVAQASKTVTIGYLAGTSYTMPGGTIDELSIWRGIMMPDTMAAIYAGGTAGNGSELYPTLDALNDITGDVIDVELSWGAGEWMGPLTLTEAGSAALTIYDPDRALDPGNTALGYPVVPGRYIRIDVDGTPIWTGTIGVITHDLAAGLSSITAADAIPELAAWAVSVDLVAGLVSDQATALLVGSGWPASRWRVEGTSSVSRKAERITGNLAAGLRRLADAEAGAVFVDRTGVVVFRCRSEAPPDHIEAVLGDDGIGVVNLAHITDRRIVNRVVVDMGPTLLARTYVDAPSEQAYGTSSLSAAAADLGLV